MGGRPGSGKSTLAQMLVIQTAVRYNEPVLVVSAEMDVETFTNRCISALTQIPYDNIHNAELFDGMLAQFADAQRRFSALPIHTEDKQSRPLLRFTLMHVKLSASTKTRVHRN